MSKKLIKLLTVSALTLSFSSNTITNTSQVFADEINSQTNSENVPADKNALSNFRKNAKDFLDTLAKEAKEVIDTQTNLTAEQKVAAKAKVDKNLNDGKLEIDKDDINNENVKRSFNQMVDLYKYHLNNSAQESKKIIDSRTDITTEQKATIKNKIDKNLLERTKQLDNAILFAEQQTDLISKPKQLEQPKQPDQSKQPDQPKQQNKQKDDKKSETIGKSEKSKTTKKVLPKTSSVKIENNLLNVLIPIGLSMIGFVFFKNKRNTKHNI